ncbi:MAG: DUF1837 domain-containing protein [Cyclobacteriaceae bacterium]
MESEATFIKGAIDKLVRGSGNELKTYLNQVCFNSSVPNTQTVTHCYHVNLDGNGRPRVQDFVELIATKIVEYCIPRSEFEKAKQYLITYQSDSELAKLRRKAESLFTDLSNSGEGGEILLYILVQEFLKIPQLLCKMPLKTSTQMHYHGVDGIYGQYDSQIGLLALYWGESKLYQSIEAGIAACFKSLTGYLTSPNGSDSPQERDLQLVKDGLDLNDTNLEDAIVKYFNKDDPSFNKLQYRGVCLVGFDYEKYPMLPNEITTEDLNKVVKKEISDWINSVEREIGNHSTLETFHIHIFLIPFPSVSKFREHFLKALNIQPRARPIRKAAKTKAKAKTT